MGIIGSSSRSKIIFIFADSFPSSPKFLVVVTSNTEKSDCTKNPDILWFVLRWFVRRFPRIIEGGFTVLRRPSYFCLVFLLCVCVWFGTKINLCQQSEERNAAKLWFPYNQSNYMDVPLLAQWRRRRRVATSCGMKNEQRTVIIGFWLLLLASSFLLQYTHAGCGKKVLYLHFIGTVSDEMLAAGLKHRIRVKSRRNLGRICFECAAVKDN